MKKNAKQKIYYEKNKDQIPNSKKVYYQKNVSAIRTQQRAYYTENAASKKCYLPPITDNIFQYVSLTNKMDIVIEQNSEYFSDIDFLRDRIVNIIKVTVRVKKINRETTMQKIVIYLQNEESF